MKDPADNSILNELRLMNIAMQRSVSGCHDSKPSMANMVMHYAYISGGSVLQKQVESAFNLRRSSVSQLLKKLEEGGYIERTCEGGKMKRITLSEKAMLEQDEISRHIKAFECRLEGILNTDEKETFIGLMRKLRGGLVTDK